MIFACRSTPPRIGAVLLDEDGCLTYTDHEPEQRILQQFFTRKDNQIASLEMLAIAYGWQPDAAICPLRCCISTGLSTFKETLRGRRVIVHSGNTIAENGVRKGDLIMAV